MAEPCLESRWQRNIEGMGLKRRTFLQQAGWILAALGLSETGLSILSTKGFAAPLLERYYQALAQPSSRKLAFLVGINEYPRSTALSGCVTDVELQRELLIHRFGFNPSDILTLTDQQATRQNIETAFIEHLTKQASEGDVVLFHFSGYGIRVTSGSAELGVLSDELKEDSSIQNSKLKTQNSLVPVDGILPTKAAAVGNNLLEETLLLLLRSLSTDQVTMVLDTSYMDAGTIFPGNLRSRSRPEILVEQPIVEELAFQEQLLQRLNTSWEQLQQLPLGDRIPGIVLAASAPTQPAIEAAWGGFSAGLFTYALTQYLWQVTSPTTVKISLSRAAEVVEQLAGKEQQPQLIGKKSQEDSLLAYNLTFAPNIGADGVVIGVEDNGKTVQLWLAGLPTRVLAYYGVHSLLSVLGSQAEAQTDAIAPIPADGSVLSVDKPLQVQIRARDGLTAKGRIVSTDASETSQLQVGQLVQEYLRVLPRHIGLTLGLDPSLERIERVDATSAFANVPYVSSVVTAGEQPVDYLFGKVRRGQATLSREDLTQDSGGGYGLFSLGGDLIPNTVGEATEAVKLAVNRLSPKLKTLLAAKLWRLSANEESSRLGVAATLEMVAPTKQVLMQRQTWRAPKKEGALREPGQGIPTLPIGSRIQYRVQNYSDRPVYFMLLGIDTTGSAFALYPLVSSPEWDTSEAKPLLKDQVIAAGETLTVPQPSSSYEWALQEPPGVAETYLVCSSAPFTGAIAVMDAAMRPQTEPERIGELFNPWDVARAVLQDLHQASALAKRDAIASFAPETTGKSSDTYALDVNTWATFSFIYQVVK
ncbi:MAG: caspase family protein [Aphanothece sp. CMT-3BRIN-NPC111]|jgi:hypothetical protein|nr:caspase family protein [Aphanothece sp. CMT-3BRIN-NPC111]